MTYYTLRLTNALAADFPVASLAMRQLMPTSWYPGAARVGLFAPDLRLDPAVAELPSVDWYWLPSLPRAVVGVLRWKPDVVLFEWWTGTVLHTYLALAVAARLRGATVVVEFHEVLDSAEERIPFARAYVRLVAPLFLRLASGCIIHSASDRKPIERRYHLRSRAFEVIPHGPSQNFDADAAVRGSGARDAPAEVINILFFGLIRPYKGLEDLVDAFDGLTDDEVRRYWLTVVGETWEGWTVPIEKIAASRHRDRMTLVNRWVADADVAQFYAGADAVALPYHRSSASAPASVAMSKGLPLIVTSVGGLPHAVAYYEGAILVPPHDPEALRAAIRRVGRMRGKRYKDPHTWPRTIDSYRRFFERLRAVANGGRSIRDSGAH